MARYQQEVLTRSEVHALLNACSKRGSAGIRNRALLVTLYRSGIRLSEALALRPEDLDPENGCLRIRPHKTRSYYAICDSLAELDAWMERRAALGIDGPTVPVFCTLTGKPLKTAYIRQVLPRLARKAGINRRIHAHALRHTFASELSAEGVPITAIRDVLGHHSVATTSVYIGRLSEYGHHGPPVIRREPWGVAA